MHSSLPVLNALTDHIALLDASGTIVAANEAWTRFGQANGAPDPTTTGVGRNYLAVCQAASGENDPEAALVAVGIAEVLAGTRDTFTLAYPCHAPQEQRWFRLSVARLEGDTGALVVHENITVEKDTVAMNARLAALVDSSDDAIFSATLNGIILSWNRGAERLFGYTTPQVIGRSFTLFVPSDQLGEPTQLLARLQRGEHIAYDIRIGERIDAPPITAALHVSPIRDAYGAKTE